MYTEDLKIIDKLKIIINSEGRGVLREYQYVAIPSRYTCSIRAWFWSRNQYYRASCWWLNWIGSL